MRIVLTTLLLLAGLFGGGCTMIALEAIDQVDETISKAAQADCEIFRVMHGKDICVARVETPEAPPQTVFCYRRLGEVDCYSLKDPKDRPIVHKPAPLPATIMPTTPAPDDDAAPAATPEPADAPAKGKAQYLVEADPADE